MRRKKNLKYYMGLPYTMEINPIAKEDGGGIEATYPELGDDAFIADGDTIEEAIKSLEEVKEVIFRDMIKSGFKIPEPEETVSYSGKFVLRIPPALHKRYSKYAKRNKISLNTAITVALENDLQREAIFNAVEEKVKECVEPIRLQLENILEMQFKIAGEKRQTIELEGAIAVAS